MSVTRHLADIGPWRVRKSGHVTVTKIENLHRGTRRKIHRFKKCYSVRSMTKNNEVIAENSFQNSGVTRRLWRFQQASSKTKHRSKAWPSWIDARRQYILLVILLVSLLFAGIACSSFRVTFTYTSITHRPFVIFGEIAKNVQVHEDSSGPRPRNKRLPTKIPDERSH